MAGKKLNTKKKILLKAKKNSIKKIKKKSVKKVSVKRKKKVLALPKGYNNVTPYLIVTNASKAIEFYKIALGAKEMMRVMNPNGKVGHAELQLGNSKIMLADECPEWDAFSPNADSSVGVSIHLYVKNVDAIIEKAISKGAKLTKPVENRYYGDRSGMIEDPYGYKWCISTHVEDVTPAQIKKRVAELMSSK
jgi:PhnB protein